MQPNLIRYTGFIVMMAGAVLTIMLIQATFDLNKSEWGSWVQAIGSIAAVFAAISLFVTQQRRDRAQADAKVKSCQEVLRQLAVSSLRLAREAEDPMYVYKSIGTWDQYKNMRAREFAEYHAFISGLPTEQLTEGGLLRSAAELRVHLRQLEVVLRESYFETGTRWNSSRRLIKDSKDNLVRICTEIGAATADLQPQPAQPPLVPDTTNNPLATTN